MLTFTTLVSLLVAAASPSQFDLTCTGHQTVTDVNGKATSEFANHLRIDVDAKKWCEGECKVQHLLDKAEPTYFHLTPERRAPFPAHLDQIDRETGKYIYIDVSPAPYNLIMRTEAQCSSAPFTGFPKVPTKF